MADKEKKFKTDIEYRIYRLLHFAKKHKWTVAHEDKAQLKFTKSNGDILKINYKHLIIETSLFHPSRGYTTLLRKGNFTQDIIESIFHNPRAHMKREKVKSEYVK